MFRLCSVTRELFGRRQAVGHDEALDRSPIPLCDTALIEISVVSVKAEDGPWPTGARIHADAARDLVPSLDSVRLRWVA